MTSSSSAGGRRKSTTGKSRRKSNLETGRQAIDAAGLLDDETAGKAARVLANPRLRTGAMELLKSAFADAKKRGLDPVVRMADAMRTIAERSLRVSFESPPPDDLSVEPLTLDLEEIEDENRLCRFAE